MKNNNIEINSLFITSTFEAPLNKTIQKSYDSLIKVIFQVPFEYYTTKKIEGTSGKISVSDIIAYQIGWGNLLIGWYESGLKGTMPKMPGEGFLTWDYKGLAHHFYKKYSYKNVEQQLNVFRDVVIRISDIVEKEYQRGNLEQKGVWQWCTLSSGKQWPLSKWVIINTASPYKRAAGLIRKFLKTEKVEY